MERARIFLARNNGCAASRIVGSAATRKVGAWRGKELVEPQMAHSMPMPARSDPGAQSRRRGWVIVALLFLVQVANYADKTVVGLASGSIMREFGLTPTQYGVVTGAFFSLYAFTGLLVAFLAAPRFKPRSIMTVLLIVWSLVQLPVVLAGSFATLIACRVLLGMGEGAGTPTALNASHEWFRSEERDMPSAVILFGSTAGSMIAAPVLTYVIQAFDWRAAFLACAVFGATVLVLWILLGRDGPYGGAVVSAPVSPSARTEVNGSRLWTDGTLWGVTLAGSAAYWLTGFMVGWLAPFVNAQTGNPRETAWLLSTIYAVQASSVLGISAVSRHLLRAGRSSRISRGIAMGLCLGVSALAFFAAALCDGVLAKVVLVGLAMSLPAPIFPLGAAMISEVAPAAERNRAMTIIMSLVTIAAIPSSIVTGALVGGAYGWPGALLTNGLVAAAGAAACFGLMHPARSAARLAANPSRP